MERRKCNRSSENNQSRLTTKRSSNHTQEVTEATGWKYRFKDLAAYDAEGNAYKYEVKEQPVDGYKSEVNGYDITNTKVAQTTVEGTKTWKDGNATDRPKTIKVDLLQNSKVIKHKK